MNLQLWVSKEGEYVAAVVVLPSLTVGGEIQGRGTSRKQDSAIAYALEDLAKKLLEAK